MSFVLNVQDDAFSCGIFALETLLSCNGINLRVKDIRKVIKADPKTGTNHDQIYKFLRSYNIPFYAWTSNDPLTLPYPSLVNYQWLGDGHYSTVIHLDGYWIHLANPGNGEYEKIPITEFKKSWYSKRYGKGWSLRIL